MYSVIKVRYMIYFHGLKSNTVTPKNKKKYKHK